MLKKEGVAEDKQMDESNSKDDNGNEKSSKTGTPEMSKFKTTPKPRLLSTIAIQFCFCFAMFSIRTNFPMNLQLKYGASISTISYLNSLQSLIGALIGFVIGPVLSYIYKGNNRNMVIHAGIIEVVRLELRNIKLNRTCKMES